MPTKINQEAMLHTFAQLQQEVNNGLGHVHRQLSAGEYAEATQSMDVISKRMAQTAVMMRTVMIKAGMIKAGGNIA